MPSGTHIRIGGVRLELRPGEPVNTASELLEWLAKQPPLHIDMDKAAEFYGLLVLRRSRIKKPDR